VTAIETMANTYTSLHYHIVFSTKNRELWIRPDVEQRVWAYLGGIAKQNRIKPLQIGGIEDHVHLLLGAPAVLAPAKIAQRRNHGTRHPDRGLKPTATVAASLRDELSIAAKVAPADKAKRDYENATTTIL
jgi:REP element-mobilizing transposase RayT